MASWERKAPGHPTGKLQRSGCAAGFLGFGFRVLGFRVYRGLGF